jgi:acetyl esterase/lipase
MIYAPDPSKPRPLPVIFHKYGAGHLDGWVDTEFFQEGRRRGWHVVCMLAASGINFASPESQQSTEAVLDWMRANYNIDPNRTYGVCFSMGGGSATSFAARQLDPSKTLFAGVVDHTGGIALTDSYAQESAPSCRCRSSRSTSGSVTGHRARPIPGR